MSQAHPSFSCSKLTIHCNPDDRITIISFVLMNGAELNASRMMPLLLALASASALVRCSSYLTMRHTTHYQLSGWVR
jgi:hypothetical protein